MIRVHLRVSSDSQDIDSQRHASNQWLAVYGNGAEVDWYIEEGVSGDAKVRPEYERLCREAAPGDTVLCFALDRLSRDGIVPLLKVWRELHERGVRIVSISEPWADTANPASEVVIAVLAWAGQQEKRRIKQRVKAGIAAAKAAGKSWGGSTLHWQTKKVRKAERRVQTLLGQGLSKSEIARVTGVNRATIIRIAKRIQGEAVTS